MNYPAGCLLAVSLLPSRRGEINLSGISSRGAPSSTVRRVRVHEIFDMEMSCISNAQFPRPNPLACAPPFPAASAAHIALVALPACY